jgi:hypothetical protein
MIQLITVLNASIWASKVSRNPFARFIIIVAFLLLVRCEVTAQGGTAINSTGAPADPSAMLDVSSLTKGLLIPRMTKVQRKAIPLPATGLIVYQTDSTMGLYINAGSPFSPDWAVYSEDPVLQNTAVGRGALTPNTTGTANAAFGDWALNRNTTGINNTAIGWSALALNTTGSTNTAVGFEALGSNSTGSGLTAIGFFAGIDALGLTNATAIGYNALVGASNSLVLGGTGSNAVKVGIGTETPTALLEVSGNPQGYIRITTAASSSGSVLEMKTNVASPNAIGAINFINSANAVPGQIAYTGSDAITLRTNGTERMRINASGNVGIGTNAPTATLDVATSASVPLLRLNQTNASNWVGLNMHNAAGYAWEVDVTNGSNPNIEFFNSNGTDLVNFDWSGNVFANTFNPGSDRNSKENFAAIDASEILAKVASLPVTRWNYKVDKKVMHVGPMAQDFRAAFGLGTDEKHIATVDADGIALAAIQGLNAKVEGLVKESLDLKEELSILKAENAQLKKINDEMRNQQVVSSAKIARIELFLQSIQPSSVPHMKVAQIESK